VDTGYATELRAKRYTIKKGASPVKDLAKFAKAVQDAAKKAQEIADKIKDAAAWALKAAREAASGPRRRWKRPSRSGRTSRPRSIR